MYNKTSLKKINLLCTSKNLKVKKKFSLKNLQLSIVELKTIEKVGNSLYMQQTGIVKAS